MSYPTYSAYKDSGVDGLSNIPHAWELRKIKRIVDTRITDGPHETPELYDEGVPFLSAEAVKNNRLDFSKKRGFISEELYKLYCKKVKPKRNDLFIVKSGATTGNVAVVETDEEFSIWSPLALVRTQKKAYYRFTYYYLQSYYFRTQVELNWSFGTQQNIGMNVLENLMMPLPPVNDQRQIAAFLDRETHHIDTLIAKQEELIALLQEKRQAIISHAVTKGLNPLAPMKDSLIPWLGEVPTHWEIKKLKYVAKILSGQSPHESTYNDNGIGYILINGPVEYSEESFGYTRSLKWTTDPKQFCKKGVVLVCLRGSTTGRMNITHDDVAIGRGVAGVECDKMQAYVNTYLRSVQAYIESIAKGSTFPSITSEDLGNIVFPIPPISEQEKIMVHLQELDKKMEMLIAQATFAINLLQERRIALISAAVTGQIDVRHKL